eukprot:2345697-Amphidinium_carterae.1
MAGVTSGGADDKNLKITRSLLLQMPRSVCTGPLLADARPRKGPAKSGAKNGSGQPGSARGRSNSKGSKGSGKDGKTARGGSQDSRGSQTTKPEAKAKAAHAKPAPSSPRSTPAD